MFPAILITLLIMPSHARFPFKAILNCDHATAGSTLPHNSVHIFPLAPTDSPRFSFAFAREATF